MPNTYFQFKQFRIHQDRSAMKVTTDACLFGAWVSAQEIQGEKILDIGTGTGLLSLMLAQQIMTGNDQVSIDAIEINKEAAAQATENIAASPWATRIDVHHQDILQRPAGNEYDVIISNPPFHQAQLSSPDPARNLAHHQQGLALGPLVQVIAANLKTTGCFYLLLPYYRKDELEKTLALHGLRISHGVTLRQSPLHDQFRIMICGTWVANSTINTNGNIAADMNPHEESRKSYWISEIIRDRNNQYTPWFARLLDPFYLDVLKIGG